MKHIYILTLRGHILKRLVLEETDTELYFHGMGNPSVYREMKGTDWFDTAKEAHVRLNKLRVKARLLRSVPIDWEKVAGLTPPPYEQQIGRSDR